MCLRQQVTWKFVDKCGNTTTKVQTITVTDNSTLYIIFAMKEAKFAELTAVIGSVGVTDALGKADFKCYTYLPSPYFVKAEYITVASPSSVVNRIMQPLIRPVIL